LTFCPIQALKFSFLFGHSPSDYWLRVNKKGRKFPLFGMYLLFLQSYLTLSQMELLVRTIRTDYRKPIQKLVIFFKKRHT